MASKNWIEYNNNPHQVNTGDCVTRGLAKVFLKTWSDMYLELAQNAIETGYLSTSSKNYSKSLERRGYVKIPMVGAKVTVNQITNIQREYTSFKPRWAAVTATHLTAIVDGNIYDTWDCSRRMLEALYVPKEHETWVKTEIIALCKKKGRLISWN